MTERRDVAAPRAEEITMRAHIVRADGTIEDLGVVGYWHRNPLRRLLHHLTSRKA